jgi:hypothetical protein
MRSTGQGADSTNSATTVKNRRLISQTGFACNAVSGWNFVKNVNWKNLSTNFSAEIKFRKIDPRVASYNASSVKIHNAKSSLVRFEKKLFSFEKTL